jgi:ABC-type uncharacterized transport system ATPase subunit
MTTGPDDPKAQASQAPVIEMRGIVKHFPGVLANDHVDLDLMPGEILGLLGENGAGKTTLMNILYGFYKADAGQIRLKGQEVDFRSSQDAIAHGLGMVHQHFMLVEVFTVAENMILGQKSPRQPLLEDPRAVEARIRDLSDRYGLEVDPQAYIWQLSVGQQQRVEILKALYRGARILILDEPTAVLTPQETDELLAIMRALADDGRSLIFISHKLHEVSAICDRIAVLRDGHLVDVVKSATPTSELARMMVGREVLLRVEKEPAKPQEVLLSLHDLWVRDDQDALALRGINLDICAGEIVGIAGVAGNGQRELEDAVSGLRPVEKGRIMLCQQDVTGVSPAKIIATGLGHIPSDRYGIGLVGDFSVAENLVLEVFGRPPFTRHGLLQVKSINDHAAELAHAFDIRTPTVATLATKLSGGNAQKLILARELSRHPRVLLAAQPTRGLDVGATEYVHKELVRQRDQGMAILLISTELEEILALSDRIIALCQGQVTGELASGQVDVAQLGLMMAGSLQSAS